MSLDRIFGGWDCESPESGFTDEITTLWNHLAAQHVGTDRFQSNSGLSQRRGEFTMLMDLYRRTRPKIVLEIGTAQGGTLAAWCFLGRPDALIVCIDRCVDDCWPRSGNQINPHIVHHHVNMSTSAGGGAYALARNNQRMVPINGWSYQEDVLETLERTLGGRKIDWLYHDASHSKEMARRDFDIYWPYVAEGGVMAFHDVMPSKVPECDKSHFWDWTRDNVEYSARYEFFGSRNDDSMGQGVLIK